MDLSDSLLHSLVDNLLIGVLVLIIGYWLKQRLETFKNNLSLQTALAPKRTEAYETLWHKTKDLTPRKLADLDLDVAKSSCIKDLRNWYYNEGNAMYLSLDSADLLLRGLTLLEHNEVTAKQIKNHFSSLRTQLKIDLGIYTKSDAQVQIPRDR